MRLLHAARQSQLKDGQTGIESSDALVHEWAERNGHVIVHVAADHKSGTVQPWKRPNLRPWVTEAAKVAQYDGIVANRFDRLSRGDDRSTSEIEAWAYEHDKVLMTVDGLEFPCEGAAGIRWDVTKRIAHEEWLNTSRRYRQMGQYLRDNGFHYGRAPYGYASVVVSNSSHKMLVPVAAEASVIRDAAEWYLDGSSLDAICEKLNATERLPRKMKNGHQPRWAPSTLSKVLHNPVIVGRQKNAAGKTILKPEPILSNGIYDRVIARMSARAKRTAVSQSKAPAMLTSVIICSNCDKPMYRSGTPRNRYYHCKTKGCRSTIRLDAADAFVNDAMLSDNRRDIVEVVVPGSGYEAEIGDVKRDLSEAVEAEEFERLPALQAELSRLRALPASPTRIERRESDVTVAEMWAAMPDDTTKRAYLLERGVRMLYDVDEDGASYLISSLGKPQTAC